MEIRSSDQAQLNALMRIQHMHRAQQSHYPWTLFQRAYSLRGNGALHFRAHSHKADHMH